MGFLRRLFGEKKPATPEPRPAGSPTGPDPADDPNLIKVFDGFGREMFITKQQWKDSVLLGSLHKVRDNHEELAVMLLGAVEDGFAADVVPFARHLMRSDPMPARGATVLAAVYMELDRLDEAEGILKEYQAAHGEEGSVLANLAKVMSLRGDRAGAEALLWHALEIDPNQDQGLMWYVSMHRERGGEAAALEVFRRVAAQPASWRPQLWLARDALQKKYLTVAKACYQEAFARAPRPIPADMLMQVSGDLGLSGFLPEIVEYVEPHFDPAIHGVQVGNNLIKAYCDLGRLEAARNVLSRLYARKRPDWKAALGFWDTELAKAEIARQAEIPKGATTITLVSIEGPLWTRDDSPFAPLLPAKRPGAPRIAMFGSTAILEQSQGRPALRLSDGPGRLSRAAPLLFAERVHLTTDAAGVAFIPWAQGQGFALFGRPYVDQDLCDLVAKQAGGEAPAFVVGFTVDATRDLWKLGLRLLRTSDRRRVANLSIETVPENPGAAVDHLAGKLTALLAEHAGVEGLMAPSWYQVPVGEDASDYLLRLEQQLAVASAHSDRLSGKGLTGEREILDGVLQLCVRLNANHLVRMLFIETLRHMRKTRPEVVAEFKDRIELLRRDHPIAGKVGDLIEAGFDGLF
jgi:tetratricopeptide (TPR) repeat protein